MHLQETILCSTAAQGTTGTVTVHDLDTGTTLASLKHTNAAQHCTAVVESRDGQGGFVLSAQPDKSILNVYHFQKVWTSGLFLFPSSFIFAHEQQDQLAMKIVLPERLTCVAVDRRGQYCAGGTAQGRIHLWEVSQCRIRAVSRNRSARIIIMMGCCTGRFRNSVQLVGRPLPAGQRSALQLRLRRTLFWKPGLWCERLVPVQVNIYVAEIRSSCFEPSFPVCWGN